MKRWIFNNFAGFSLLLAVFFAGMWMRSWWRLDSIGWRSGNRQVALASSRGCVEAGDIHFSDKLPASEPGGLLRGAGVATDLRQEFARFPYFSATFHFGFGIGREHFPDVFDVRFVILPHWFLVGLCGILPTLWLRSHRRIRRVKYRLEHGLCRKCGYDLRASNERCPECGREIVSASRQGEGAM